ncbi:MAG TPA: aminodeoxychorismate synthase component I [Actinomycetota bacterium]|nr:aminodeoxychorismate synthase component I [Actinomycetota bacterium]
MVEARFDDLRPGRERSFRLVEPLGSVQAREPSAVPDALDRVEAAVGRGLWAGGFVAYEAAPGLDPALTVRSTRHPSDPLRGLPLVWFGLFRRCERVPPLRPEAHGPVDRDLGWRPSVGREQYEDAVSLIRERIAAGDTYQVNHTFRLRTRVPGSPVELYRDLCLAQRGGYAAFLDAGGYLVLSASPELFLRIEGDRITTRPMKGTTPRGRWPAEDARAARALQRSSKDRAENAMIVDLLRSDLGRIARPGTVRADPMFEAERYETLWQLTSTITGATRPGTRLRDVFAALFPSGSVTGAPKVAAMRLICELEDSPRGIYCGSIGYLAPEGSGEPRANLNVAIRTVVLDRRSGAAEYGVGGGITYDSSSSGEYREALAKTRVLTARRPEFQLLETILHRGRGGFRHLHEHLARLRGSAGYFGFALDPEAVELRLKQARAELGDADGLVRLLLARDGTVQVRIRPRPAPHPGPVTVALDTDPVDPSDVWLFHKTTLRERYERRRAARPDVDDVLLINTRGEVTESTIANLAVRLDGRWVTPPLASGLLPGAYRDRLVRGGRLRERPISLEEVSAAPGLALVNSARGWRSARLRG